ncbi:hypothetical protein QAD02_016587 [Eretmocerus hayati]|uniref:Uncharacterized protein n=1 Tax=Eretmocerus hayati TaxID=131215 RepID=A0ACC2PB21_9HYME|nr:hypothetical protein QAD02_016587 [Eretmocerus hayati]
MDLMRMLLEAGVNVDLPNASLKTPLHAVLSKKDEECASLLISYGCSVNTQDKCNDSPLMTAVDLILENSVRLLLAKGADPNYTKVIKRWDANSKTSILAAAVKRQNLKIIRLLFEYGADTSCKDSLNDLIDIAMWNGNSTLMKYLIDKGAKVNSKLNDTTLLSRALGYGSGNGRENIVQILLDHGANVKLADKNGKTALERFRDSRNLIDKTVLCLVRHLALMRSGGQTIGKKNYSLLKNDAKFKKYYRMCINELSKMRMKKIFQSSLSLYDILTRTENEMIRCLQNKNIVETIRSSDLSTDYPLYSWNLRYKLAKAQERSNLMNKGRHFLNEVIDVEMPPEIITLICEYLKNEDLTNLGKISLHTSDNTKSFSMSLRTRKRRKYC